MKKFLLHILMVVPAVCLTASVNNQPEIKLNAGKDRVLPTQLRKSILEVAEVSLNRFDEAFAATLENVKNPYPVGDTTAETGESIMPEEILEVYDDESVLELIRMNFAPQIRGTLAKGDVYYLQLNGGGMLKEGTSFPVEIPQIEGESFTVTVLEITPNGYTLKMKDITRGVIFEQSSGIIKKTQE